MICKIKRNELYNYSILCHFIQRLILYSSFYNIIPGIIPTLFSSISIICLVLKCMAEIRQEEFAFKWLMSVMVFFPLVWIGSIFANSDELVWILIYIITAKNVEPESIARTIYAVCGFGTCVIMLSALIGIIPNNYELAINEAGKVTIRMYMGFIHCNVFGSFLSTIFLCHFFIRFNRLNKFDYLFGALLTAVCAFVAYSRTNAIIMLIAILSIRYFAVPVKSRLKIALFVMSFIAVASVALSVNYNPSYNFMVELNTMLTGRLSAAKSAYDQYGFSIMGQDFQTIFQTSTVAFGEAGMQQQVIDNAFMHMLVHYGILPTALLMWYYFSNVIWLYKRQRMDILFVVLLSFIQGITEGTIYSSYNAVLFILATMQYDRTLE